MKKLLVTQVRSSNKCTKKQLANLQALGLTKINEQALHEDNAAIRGMCNKVSHLITVEEVEVQEEAR
ncbi:MAG: 50S ribosomal protein L30 [Eubacteriales bacterium]|nr:50S ribosomal protein L30 [Eubacteriales bacterium]